MEQNRDESSHALPDHYSSFIHRHLCFTPDDFLFLQLAPVGTSRCRCSLMERSRGRSAAPSKHQLTSWRAQLLSPSAGGSFQESLHVCGLQGSACCHRHGHRQRTPSTSGVCGLVGMMVTPFVLTASRLLGASQPAQAHSYTRVPDRSSPAACARLNVRMDPCRMWTDDPVGGIQHVL